MILFLWCLLSFSCLCEASIITRLYSKEGVLPYKLEKLAFALTDGQCSKFQVLKRYIESDLVFDEFETQLYQMSSKIKASIPFLQMYDQLYRDTVIPSLADYRPCRVWTAVAAKQICDLEELSQLLNSKGIGESVNHRPQMFTFDISNPSKCHDELPVVILYGDPSDSEIVDYFQLLREKSDAGEICFIFRFKLDSYQRGRFTLSGYGVELALKSTEYKVVDDRVISNISVF